MYEWLVLLALTLSGFVLARITGIRGWLTACVAFPLGTAAFVGVGLLQVSLFLPTWPLLALSVSLVGSLLIFALRRGWRSETWREWIPLAAVVGFGTVVHFVVRSIHLVNWHTDSLFNVESSMLLADNDFVFVSTTGASKRQLAVPLIHALSIQLDDGVYLETFAPMLAASTVGILWLLLRARLSGGSGRWGGIAVVLAVLVVVTNNRFVFHAFYVNGHLLFAVLLLVTVGLLWARESRLKVGIDHRGGVLVPAMVLPALTVTRPEGAIVIGLLVVVVWTLDLQRRDKVLFTLVAGLSIALWHARLSLVSLLNGASVPFSSYGLLVFGIVLAVSPLVWTRLPSKLVARGPAIVEAALWAALLAFIAIEPYVFAKSVYATGVNLLFGAGGWGFSLVALGVVGGLALLLFRGSSDLIVRYPLSTFVPLAFLLSYLREGAYRIGDGDSLNRMWMQFFPLLVLFIAQRVFDGELRFARPGHRDASAAAGSEVTGTRT